MQIKKIATLTGHNGSVFALAEGEAKHLILSGAGDGWVVQWDLNNPDLGRLIAKANTTIYAQCHIPELQQLIVGDMNGEVHWISLSNPENQRNWAHHQKGVFGIQHIDNQVITIGGDGVLTKWDIQKQRSTDSIQLSNHSLRAMAYSKVRNEIAIGSSDRNIYILDSRTLTLKTVIENAHANSVFSLAYSPDNQWLISGGRDAMLRVWAIGDDYKLHQNIAAHLFTINDLVFHPEGHLFATASRDKTIKIWDSEHFSLLKVIDTVKNGCHINSVNTLQWSPFNHWLISGSDDRSLMIWEITS